MNIKDVIKDIISGGKELLEEYYLKSPNVNMDDITLPQID